MHGTNQIVEVSTESSICSMLPSTLEHSTRFMHFYSWLPPAFMLEICRAQILLGVCLFGPTAR